jgi:subtilisin family serine protease
MWVNTNETPDNGIDDDNNGYIDDYIGYNFINNTGNPMGDDGHGTHVAGIVLGATTDIMATHVDSAKIRIMPLKFLGPSGSGSTSNAIRAIYYAVNMGAKVLNNSWGGGTYSQALNEAIAYSYQQKVVFVAAAGNSGQNSDVNPMYPAAYDTPHIISVAATNDWDYLPTFSNYGKVSVDVASPGVSILSTLPNNSFGYSSGTSMAAPFVSGVAALMAREAPELTGYQIRELIGNSSDRFSQLANTTSFGGRINAYSAVQYAKGGASTLAYQPDYSVSASANNRELASEISSGGAQGGCGLVSGVAAQYASGSGGGNGPIPPLGIIGAIMLLPFIVWKLLKSSQPAQRRKHERFVMKSQVKVMVGERELVGSINTISVGGASFSSDAMLEKGGLITMKITAPDGTEQVEVQGRIVWSEENKSYGVQFADAKDGVVQSISGWTKSLVKAA